MSGFNQDAFEDFALAIEKQCATETEDAGSHLRLGLDERNPATRGRFCGPHAKQVRRFRSSEDITITEAQSRISKVLDLKGLAARCMDDEEVMMEVMGSFVEQCDDRIQSLQTAVEEQDFARTVFDLDFISGAAKNVGAVHLDDSVAELMAHIRPAALPPHQSAARRSSVGDVSTSFMKSDKAQRLVKQIHNEFLLALKFWQNLHGDSELNPWVRGSFVRRCNRLNSYLACDSSRGRGVRRDTSVDSTTVDAVDVDITPTEIVIESTHFNHEDWEDPETVTAFLQLVQERMGMVRKCFLRGKRETVVLLVEDMLKYSKMAEMKGLSKKLSELLLKQRDEIRMSDILQLEQQLDASKAIWFSSGLRV